MRASLCLVTVATVVPISVADDVVLPWHFSFMDRMMCDLSAKIAKGLKLIRSSLSSVDTNCGRWGIIVTFKCCSVATDWFVCFDPGERCGGDHGDRC